MIARRRPFNGWKLRPSGLGNSQSQAPLASYIRQLGRLRLKPICGVVFKA